MEKISWSTSTNFRDGTVLSLSYFKATFGNNHNIIKYQTYDMKHLNAWNQGEVGRGAGGVDGKRVTPSLRESDKQGFFYLKITYEIHCIRFNLNSIYLCF